MRKIFFFFVLYFFSVGYTMAENVSGFSIPTNYLQAGKLKVNSVGVTTFQVDIGFMRGLAPSPNPDFSYESANIDFKIVAFNISTGAVIQDLTPVYNVQTSDFGSDDYVSKNYSVNITYSSLNISAASVRIRLLWKSSRNFPPAGYPQGMWVWSTSYEIHLITPPPPCTPNIIGINNDNNGSDLLMVQFRNPSTGAIVYQKSMFNGNITGTFVPGVYNILVFTDSQGYVKLEKGTTYSNCQDAFSWSGDSKAYYFNNVNVSNCIDDIVVTIDDIECN